MGLIRNAGNQATKSHINHLFTSFWFVFTIGIHFGPFKTIINRKESVTITSVVSLPVISNPFSNSPVTTQEP